MLSNGQAKVFRIGDAYVFDEKEYQEYCRGVACSFTGNTGKDKKNSKLFLQKMFNFNDGDD